MSTEASDSHGRNRLSTGAFKRLSGTSEKLCDAWFPPNPAVLSLIKQKLKDDSYEEDIDLFLEDLKTDSSLYLYCIGALAKESSSNSEGSGCSPLSLVRGASFKTYKSILDRTPEEISIHNYSKSAAQQASCVMHAMISASAASALCFPAGVHPDVGFSVGLLRQLGYTLIAYNYPNVFKRTLQKVKEGDSLEDTIVTVLGWTPMHLGVSIARAWSLNAESRLGMGDEIVRPEANSEEIQIAEVILDLCEIGEQYARASQPDLYPSAFKDSCAVKEKVINRLGRDGLQKLSRRVKLYCRHYSDSDCATFKLPQTLEKDGLSHDKVSEAKALKEIRISSAPLAMQEKLLKYYDLLELQGATYNNFKLLAEQIVPEAGFTGGCVYLMDFESKTLTPRITFCSTRIEDTYAIFPVSEDSHSQLIQTAYNSSIIFAGSGNKKYFCSAIGEHRKIGVLFLEPNRQTSKEDLQKMQSSYAAINEAISAYFSCF